MHPYKQVVLLLLCSFSALSQNLHTPADIQKIITKSERVYILDTLTKAFETESQPILGKNSIFSIALQEKSVKLYDKHLSKKTKKQLKRANNEFEAGKLEKAHENYLKVYENTKSATLLPRLAYCYEKSGQLDKALIFYKTMLSSYPFDAAIHSTIARLYYESGENSAAINHIQLAHLYDRNHPEYIETLIQYFNDKGWEYKNLSFAPIYQIQVDTDSSIVIQAQPSPWQSYANCKAIWSHEPGYKEKMKYLASVDVRVIEEKECLLNALISFEKLSESKDSYPMLSVLAKVLPEKRIDDFILYEISLRKYPAIAQQLSAKRLEQLIDYIVNYRVTRPVNLK